MHYEQTNESNRPNRMEPHRNRWIKPFIWLCHHTWSTGVWWLTDRMGPGMTSLGSSSEIYRYFETLNCSAKFPRTLRLPVGTRRALLYSHRKPSRNLSSQSNLPEFPAGKRSGIPVGGFSSVSFFLVKTSEISSFPAGCFLKNVCGMFWKSKWDGICGFLYFQTGRTW
jgi:hypothetical protein